MYSTTTSLYHNSFLATFQLLFWLIFRPSAWQTMVARIDLELPADFALSELSFKQWRHPILLRLLSLIYVLGPILTGIIVGLWLWWLSEDLTLIVRGVIYAISLGFIGGLTCSITVSVAFGFVASIISSLLIGLSFGMDEIGMGEMAWYKMAILSGIFGVSLASSVLLSLASELPQKEPIIKMGKLFVSLLVALVIFSGAMIVSGVIFFIVVTILNLIPPSEYYLLIEISFGLIFAFAFALYTRRWLLAGIMAMFAIMITVHATFWWTINEYALVNPLMGGISNGFLFALLFALPYSLAQDFAQKMTNPMASVVAGLLGSGGLYVAFFMGRHPDNPILLSSIIALGLGISHTWWPYILNFLMDSPFNHWNRIRQFWHWITKKIPKILYGLLHIITQLLQSKIHLESIVQTSKQTVNAITRQIADTSADKKIEMPYITGIPLTLQNKHLFVGRTNVSNRIELLLQEQRSPPILLYGQRRMGKTSLLIFLKELLPDNYIPLFIDFQGPVSSASDYSGFLYTISRAIIRSARHTRQLNLPPLNRNTLQDDPFTEFDEWLDSVEECVENRVLLLTFDEFEALEHVFEKGRLDRGLVLGMLRHIIQHRPRFKIMIAGAYQLDAFPHWSNYLINVETVKLSYLQESEAIQLIERPVNHFSLRYTPEATQRVLTLTHCHPALIQLLCKEIVFLKNQQAHSNRNVVQLEDVESAVPHAMESGKNYFIHITQISSLEAQILHVIATESGECSALSHATLAKQCFSGKIEGPLSSLLKRELIELTSTGYRFQVEFIRRWFIEL